MGHLHRLRRAVLRRGPASLQARLVLTDLALLAAACVILGTAGVLTLERFLVERLDTQLTAAVDRSTAFRGPPPGPEGSSPDPQNPGRADVPDFLLAPGQGEGTLGARIENGQVVEAGVLDSAGERVPLSEEASTALAGVPADGVPRDVALDGLGDYRVAASQTPDGVVLLTGLPLAGVDATVTTLAGVAIGVGIAVLLLAAAVGTALTRRTLRPLARVAATAREVTELPLHAGEVSLPVRVPRELTDDGTEVGQVGSALNQLIDHVGEALQARQASETKLRRFVADASHELRTPLAAIRGYAELTRRSREATPPEVSASLDRVEAAALRMTALVEDLLLLARLDAGRPGRDEPVDLTSLCLENLADARAAGPDHSWTLQLPAEPVTVRGDAGRLHQVVANLLTNARVHTPPGTRVALSVTTSPDDAAVLEVRDDGPGIAADVLPHVFERFTRGDSSRSRAAGSSGLGLSIVAAVVEAHGGQVSAKSVPGRTVLRVVLPAPAGPAAHLTADAQDASRIASRTRATLEA